MTILCASPKKWTFYTKKHYKIWFSKDPNEFLDSENLLRFAAVATRNSDVHLSFIYSAGCLNSNAIHNLKIFCAKYKITPLDFDTDIPKLLAENNCKDAADQDLYNLAEQEIKNTLANQGGNFAAASDIVRLLLPVTLKCGFYNDFETQMDFSSTPAFIECDSPIILNNAREGLNNDSIAVAIDKENATQLAAEAKTMIMKAQRKILLNYQSPQSAILSEVRKYDSASKPTFAIVKNYFEKYPTSTIFELRKFFQDVDFAKMMELFPRYMLIRRSSVASEEEMKLKFGNNLIRSVYGLCKELNTSDPLKIADTVSNNIKHTILLCSVVAITGPCMLDVIFDEPFADFLKSYSRQSNMKGMYEEEKATDLHKKHKPEQEDKLSDLSWTLRGATQKKERCKALLQSTLTIQRRWKKHHKKMDIISKALNSPASCIEDVTAVERKIYSSALIFSGQWRMLKRFLSFSGFTFSSTLNGSYFKTYS